ncbi:hypothetical protein P5P81_02730 [Tritonibacter mobilis]|nr:hypothetical protein [Tritonibacter mobilis]
MKFISKILALFGARTGRIGAMIRASLSVLGSDLQVFVPFLCLFVLKAGRGLLALVILYLGFVTQDWERLFPLMLVFIIYLPVEMILQTFLQAAMSQMARDTLIEGHINRFAIVKTLLGNLFSLLFIGFVSYLLRRASESKQSGFLGFLVAIVVFVVAEVWDLVSNFGISAIVVERAGVKTLVARLKELRSHVPETLVGVIGIDLAGGVAQSLFAGGVVLGLFGGGAVGYQFATSLPDAFLAHFGEIPVNTLPTLSLLALSFILSAVIASATVLAKSLYFTSLYLFVVHKGEVPDDKLPALARMLQDGKDASS